MKTPLFKPLASLFGVFVLSAISAYGAVTVTSPAGPTSVSVRDGLSTTLSITAQTDVASPTFLLYSWRKRNPAPPDQVLTNTGGYSGVTTSTLKITNAQAVHAGEYYAIAYESTDDSQRQSSPDFTVMVNVRPKIAQQPASQTKLQGTTLSLQAVLSTDTTTTDLTYRWQKNNVDIPTAGNATADDAILEIPNIQLADAASYRVIITSPLTTTTVTSKAAVIKVDSKPVILKEPAADTAGTLYIASGGSGKLAVVAAGNPKLLYSWEKGPAPGAAVGNTTATLNLKGEMASEGVYRVKVTNGIGETYSADAQVVVVDKPTVPGAIVVTSNTTPTGKDEYMAGPIAPAGPDAEVTLTITPGAGDVGVLQYQWQRDGKNILDGDGVSGAQTAAIKFAPLSWLHRGVYRCIVTNEVGVFTSKTYTLKVNSAPIIITRPVDLVGIEGKSATFTVVAGGTAPLKYQWYKKSGGNDVLIEKATAAKLTLSKITNNDELDYFVVVTNTFNPTTGVSTEPLGLARLTVDKAVKIGLQPTAAIVTTGQPLTLTLTTSEGDGPIKFQWQRNNVNLVDDVRIVGAFQERADPMHGTSVALSIADVTAADAGTYRCIVSNAAGQVTVISKPVKVTVVVAPTILPGGQPLDQDVYEDSTVTFTVKAAGSPALKYQWERAPIVAGAPGTFVPLAGKTAATLTLSKVVAPQLDIPNDQGYYRVKISNPSIVTIYSDPAKLTINKIPFATITSIIPHKARVKEKVRVIGTFLDQVTEARFGGPTGLKATFVKESATSLVMTIPPGLDPTIDYPITVKTKPGTTASPDRFTLSLRQINDRDNPFVATGSNFPRAFGRTTSGLTSTYNLPGDPDRLSEGVYLWTAPRSGLYRLSASADFPIYSFINIVGGNSVSYIPQNAGVKKYSVDVIVNNPNSDITMSFFGVIGRFQSGENPFGTYSATFTFVRSLGGPPPVGFDAAEGIDASQPLAGQAGWQMEGSGSATIVDGGEGEQMASFTGNSSEGSEPTVLWKDASDVQAGADSVVRAEWTMAIDQAGAGTEGHFGWQVSGADGAPLGQLQFSVADGAIYLVQPDGSRTLADPQLVPGSQHRFEITTDLGNATWQARMDGVALGEPQPITAGSGYGDVSVVWYPASGASTKPTMTFDDVTFTVD